MVVPNYLGAMTLGGLGAVSGITGLSAVGGMPGLGGIQLSGASLQQYNNSLLMSNFTNINPALQLRNLPDQSR